MAFNRSLGVKGLNALTRKILYRRILRRIIVVGIPKKYISIVYRG